jgi:UDP-4-amino-4,6-dideoxy-N-acetyl-beta-L-altrosamine transaminase
MPRDRRHAPIPYGHHWIDEDDVAAVVAALRDDWITQGPLIERFEEEIARVAGARHAVAFSSGTAALHGACFAAGIGPGDEVVTSPLSFVASANCVLYAGGRAVFADVSEDTGNLDPARAARAITPRTRALLPVDFGGHPADLDALRALARERGLTLIEDASHAIGGRLGGRSIGSLADLTTFSFHPVKTITTGEGGAVTTDDDRLAARLRLFRTHGITKAPEALVQADVERGPWYYEMQELGFNYRITDIQCALGLSQLRRLDAFVARRLAIAARYNEAFGADPALRVPATRPGAEPAWHLYPLRLRLDRLRTGRRAVFEALRARGLGVQVHYIPTHLQPYYRKHFGHAPGEFPAAEAYSAGEISLPLFPRMTDADVADVIAIVGEVIAEARA